MNIYDKLKVPMTDMSYFARSKLSRGLVQGVSSLEV